MREGENKRNETQYPYSKEDPKILRYFQSSWDY